MCGGGGGLGGIGKVINKVTGLHDKLDPLGKKIRDPIEDALGVPRSGEIGTALFGGEAQAADNSVDNSMPEATNVADGVQAARDAEKRRRAVAAGMSGTILGGGAGTGTGPTNTKTLLGA